MGQEIESSHVTRADIERFEKQLHEETAILRQYFQKQGFGDDEYKAGFELEACLLDSSNHAAPENDTFLKTLDSPDVVPELATFNVELNGAPQVLEATALDTLYSNLLSTWQQCQAVAGQRDEKMVMIGILPQLREQDFCMENMSHLSRYKALNEQLLKMRDNRPLHLHIEGREVMDTLRHDVMLEAATTSFQIHFQIPLQEAAAQFNASLIASAPMVAVSANSPYLFGKDLWAETRVPLFEQSVKVGHSGHRRAGFGNGYLHESLLECFEENLHDYPVLLPLTSEADPARLTYLKFHNGTIWRWNRPLIDFDRAGKPCLRIEHRVVPSGPTIRDSIANAAFYYGLSHGISRHYPKSAALIPFGTARDNFYLCARDGLDARVTWEHGKILSISDLVLEHLLPLAETGLRDLGLDEASISAWLHIIEGRVETGQNGAAWQRAWVRKCANGSEEPMMAMINQYQQLQDTETPVHEWPLTC